MPSAASVKPSAITAPATTAMEIVRPTNPRPTGSTFVLSMATRSSVFIFGLPRDKGRQCPQPAVDVDLDTGFRDAAPHRRLRYTSPLKLHAFNGAPHFFRQPAQKYPDVVRTLGVCMVVLRQDL